MMYAKSGLSGIVFCLLFIHTFSQIQVTSGSLTIIPTEEQEDSLEKALWTNLRVYVGDTVPEGSIIPPVLGKVSLSGDTIIFRPVFPFREGQKYVAVWKIRNTFHFHIPVDPSHPLPGISDLFPSSPTIPANQLKFYLHFSTPMQEGKAYDNVRVRDESGSLLPDPFVPLQPELWDETKTRLTLWLDPGRIKRGLASNEAQGEVLMPGERIILEVDSAWKDIYGQPLGHTYSQIYEVGDYDRSSPEPDQWKIHTPKAGTREPVRIEFGESLDRALLEHTLSVLDESQKKIEGVTNIQQHETHWVFSPDEAWERGEYIIQIDAILEDLAGNNLNRLFDRDLRESFQDTEQEIYYLKMEIK